MRASRNAVGSAILLVLSTLPAAGQVCSLVGDQVTLTVASPTLPGTANATVQAGPVEFNPAPGDSRFSVDVESLSIRIFNNTANSSVTFNNPTTYTVSEVNGKPRT